MTEYNSAAGVKAISRKIYRLAKLGIDVVCELCDFHKNLA
jgi:hypothetical protein